MRNAARRAGVAAATAYTYFGSKDHLVAEVFWRRLDALPEPRRRRRRSRRSSGSPRRCASWPLLVADEPELAAASTTAILARDPDVQRLRDRIGAAFNSRLQAALGADHDPAVLRALNLAFAGALLQAGMGYFSYTELADRMRRGRQPSSCGDGAMTAPTRLQPVRVRDPRGPVPHLRPAARRGAGVPQRRRRLLGAVPPRRRGGGLPRQRALLVAARRVARPGRVRARTPTGRCRSSPWTRRCTGACAGSCRAGFTPRRVAELEPRIRELTREHLDAALEPGHVRLHRRPGRQAADGRHQRADRRARRPTATRCAACPTCSCTARRAWTTCRPPASRPPSRSSTYYADMLAQRRARPTDDLTSALLAAEVDGDRLTDDEIMGFLFLMVVAGNETTTKLLGNAWYWAWRNPDRAGQAVRRPGPRSRRGSRRPCATTRRRQMLARLTTEDVELHGTVDPRRRAGGAAWSARPTATSACSPTPTRYDLDRPERELQQIASFGFGRHFCLGASLARLEARVCLEELVARVADYDIDADGDPPRPLRQRPRLRRPPHHGGGPLMPRFDPHPERRAAVVTGASSGHGLATALALAAAGHPVVLGARRLDRLEETAAKIVADGGEAIGLPLDLTDDASIDAFAAAAQERLGPIEVVVSNAGDVLPATALGVDPDDFARQVQVNVLGAHRLVNRLGPAMVERQRGDIVFVTSDVVRVPRTYMAAYVTSKNALEGLARAMQMELEGTGVRVGIVRPGPVDHRAGHDLDRGHRRRGDGRLGALGRAPPRRRPPRPGRRPRRRSPSSPRPAAPTSPSSRSSPKPLSWRNRMTVADTEIDAAAPGLGRGRPDGHRPPRGAARRPDRADGAHPRRVRRRRHVPPRRPRRRAPHRARRQRDLLPGARGGPRPGRGLPVHDADLRRGRGVRRIARGAAQGAPQPGPARQVHARPRRDHRRRGRSHGRPSRPTAARSTCSTGSPS